jgi:acyl homoserine lactone synthase
MMYMITRDRFGEFVNEIAEMHRLRYRVFKGRLDWDVTVSGDMEIDEYDALGPIYLLHRNHAGRVEGCVRLLPTTGPTMLRDSFPALLGAEPAPFRATVWESSRFCIDVDAAAPKAELGLSCATFELFAGMCEFGLARGLTEIVTVTDVFVERIVKRIGIPWRRISQPNRIGNSLAVAGFAEVSWETLARIRRTGGLTSPVLWEPVPLRAIA